MRIAEVLVCVRMYMCTCHYVAYMPQVSYIFAIVATLASLLVISYNFHRHIYDEPICGEHHWPTQLFVFLLQVPHIQR